MIITCPSCSARYRVKDELIKSKGKRVKCKKCEAVFIAYPDKDPVLEKTPDQAKIMPQHNTAQKPAPAKAPASQATVMVDRSQLDRFMKSEQKSKIEGAQSKIKADPDQFNQSMDNQGSAAQDDPISAGATVQVDRSQIDAFLQGSISKAPPPPYPSEPTTQDTVQFDEEALSAAIKKEPEQGKERETGLPFGTEPTQTHSSSKNPGTSKDPGLSGGNPFAETTSRTGPSSPAAGEVGDLEEPITSTEPAFPSDADLGINDPPAAGINDPPAADLNAVTQAMDSFPPAPEIAPFTPEQSAPPTPEPAPAPTPAPEELYQAQIDDNIYPNLRKDAIERWIREDRLLEADLIAPNGTSEYKRADSYAEFASFFDQIESKEIEPPKKKGFFGWLFSIFKR